MGAAAGMGQVILLVLLQQALSVLPLQEVQ